MTHLPMPVGKHRPSFSLKDRVLSRLLITSRYTLLQKPWWQLGEHSSVDTSATRTGSNADFFPKLHSGFGDEPGDVATTLL